MDQESKMKPRLQILISESEDGPDYPLMEFAQSDDYLELATSDRSRIIARSGKTIDDDEVNAEVEKFNNPDKTT